MRKLIFNLHLYTALIAGLFVIILGLTGSIIAFESELDVLFHPSLFKVQVGPQLLPVTTIQESVKNAYPHQKLGLWRLPTAPDQAYAISLQPQRTEVFINGYTGKIIGTRSLPTVLSQIHQLHMRLLMGRQGSTIVAIVAFVTVWLLLSGIYLWWPLKRVKVKTSASFRRVVFDLHNAVGIYSAVFLLVLAVTGIVIYWGGGLSGWLNHITHASASNRSLSSPAQKGEKPITPGAAIQIARVSLPGATPGFVLSPAGPRGSYTILMHFPEDRTGTRSWVNIDQYSGKVLAVESSRTAPLGTKVETINREIHTGEIYGYPTKILMSLASLMLVIQVITGYCMWWKKLRLANAALARQPDKVTSQA